ncbi:MAG: glycosyltransferase [Spirochaetota bacterium]
MSFSMLFLVLAIAMVAIHLGVVAGALASVVREPGRGRTRYGAARPSVDVLVPARDEEALLPRLLERLREQDTDRFNVILVNDRSADATPLIMEEFRAALPGRVTIVTLIDDPPHGNPKQRALASGSEHSTADVILMTDADCLPHRSWVRTMSAAFGDPEVGLAFGSVIPHTEGLERAMRPLDRFQSFDQTFRFQYTAGAAGLGAPSGGYGNNMAVRREALDAAGGFAGLRYSPTEDAQLIAQVRETGAWKIRAIRGPGAHVAPAPEATFRELIEQSIRWNTGGLFAPDRTTRVSYGIVMLYLFASVLIAPLGLLYAPLALPALGSFTSMVILGLLAGALNRREPLYWLLLVPNVLVAMLFYTYVTILTLARVPVSWKGQKLSGKTGEGSGGDEQDGDRPARH